ncbi:MAG: class I SAM-dependent methyltransferase [Planctomycetota bacterium]
MPDDPKTFSTPAICLCGADDAIPFRHVERMGCGFRVVRCRFCGHVYMSPRPSAEEIRAMYGEGYYRGEAPVRYRDERSDEGVLRPLAQGRLERIEKVAGRRGRLLDVGCAFGLFPAVAAERGWEAVGVDLSEFAAEEGCRRYGLDIRAGTIEAQGFPPGSFDVITAFEFVEHLESPGLFFDECARILRPGGWLVIQTSNVESVYARLAGARWVYFIPCHLHYFSPRSLRVALKRSGFSVEFSYCGTDIPWRSIRRGLVGRGVVGGLVRHVLRKMTLGPVAVGGGMVVYARAGGVKETG